MVVVLKVWNIKQILVWGCDSDKVCWFVDELLVIFGIFVKVYDVVNEVVVQSQFVVIIILVKLLILSLDVLYFGLYIMVMGFDYDDKNEIDFGVFV